MERWIPIPLTAKHLADGRQYDCDACPVALALQEATGQIWHVTPHVATLESPGGGSLPERDQHWYLPDDMRHLIYDIDAGREVKPCTLRLPRQFAPLVRQIISG